MTQEDTALAEIQVRLSDKLLFIKFQDQDPVLLHVEFQTEGDINMPRRMALYLAMILEKWAALEKVEGRKVRLATVVIYLSREDFRHDPGNLHIQGKLGLEFFISYGVIKLWELDPLPILEIGNPGMLPFVPLMSGNAKELVVKSKEKILQLPGELLGREAKEDLLVALIGFAGRVIDDRDFLRKLITEVFNMSRNYVFEIIQEDAEKKGREEGRVEGRVEGAIEEARKAIIKVLSVRFGELPREFSTWLAAQNNLERLEELVGNAAVCPSLESFTRLLNE